MINLYTSKFPLPKWSVTILILMNFSVHSQEPRVFTTADYDLAGEVKRCLVITNYGKEAFDFNRDGLLTKITTVYSETDYDITYFRYSNGLLTEKRLESYREDKLDRQTSIANIFEVDTLLRKVVKEQIYSYQKEFLDQFEYTYDLNGNLMAITRTSNEGIDETRISYDTLKGEVTRTVEINGIIDNSIRTTQKKENGQVLEEELVKTYLRGDPYKATETLRDTLGRKLREIEYTYDPSKTSFMKAGQLLFEYGEKGFLKSLVKKVGKHESRQEYIYQFDAHDPPNWIKEIVTPENEYTTRRITYYEEEIPKDSGDKEGG